MNQNSIFRSYEEQMAAWEAYQQVLKRYEAQALGYWDGVSDASPDSTENALLGGRSQAEELARLDAVAEALRPSTSSSLSEQELGLVTPRERALLVKKAREKARLTLTSTGSRERNSYRSTRTR